MNRQYRRKLEKLQRLQEKSFIKKNKDFLEALRGDGSTMQAMEKLRNFLDTYGQQRQTSEGEEETLTSTGETTEVEGNSEVDEQVEVGGKV